MIETPFFIRFLFLWIILSTIVLLGFDSFPRYKKISLLGQVLSSMHFSNINIRTVAYRDWQRAIK